MLTGVSPHISEVTTPDVHSLKTSTDRTDLHNPPPTPKLQDFAKKYKDSVITHKLTAIPL